MYIFCMRFRFLLLLGMFFFTLSAKAGDTIGLVPAEKKARGPALFSFSGTDSTDSSVSAGPVVAITATKPPRPDSVVKAQDSSARLEGLFGFKTGNVISAKAAAPSVSVNKKNKTVNETGPASGVQKPKQTNREEKAEVVKKPHNDKRSFHGKSPLPLAVAAVVLVVIIFLVRRALKKAQQPTFVTTTRLSIMDKEVQNACRYIEKNYKNKTLSLETMCADLVTGKAFLNALFVQELGLSVEDFISHVRINRARMFLEKNKGIDAEIAAGETGFDDVLVFRAAFAKIVGVSFEEYCRIRPEPNA